MEFAIPPAVEAQRRLVRAFVNDRLIPLEADPASYDAHENIRPDLLTVLRAETRAIGIWALRVATFPGGRGLGLN